MAQRLIYEAQNGVNIGYRGPEETIISRNWPSAWEFKVDIDSFISTSLKTGKIVGPFATPPENFRSSPLGAFTKKRSTKVRIIHDLSHPHYSSVNDGISKEEFSTCYTSVDDAVTLIQKHPDPWLCKIDLAAAYQSVKVRDEDLHLLGFSWPNEEGTNEYFSMGILPFGMRSSPHCFNNYATALLWVAKRRGLTQDALNYLDDYICICCSEQHGATSLDILECTVKDSGFEVQKIKTVGPAKVLEFLGIVLDCILCQLRISAERLQEVSDMLSECLEKRKATKRDLLAIVGKLQFCARVIRDGKFFIRRIIDLSKEVHYLHQEVLISQEAKADMRWWVRCIDSHNGKCMFPIPFDMQNCQILLTDASDLAAAAVYGNQWTILEFTGENQWLAKTKISLREMIAVLLALATFGQQLADQQVLMNVDNQNVVQAIQGSKSRDPKLMQMVRALYMYTKARTCECSDLVARSLELVLVGGSHESAGRVRSSHQNQRERSANQSTARTHVLVFISYIHL